MPDGDELFDSRAGSFRGLYKLPEMSGELKAELRAVKEFVYEPPTASKRLRRETKLCLDRYEELRISKDDSIAYEWALVLAMAVRDGPSGDGVASELNKLLAVCGGMPIGAFNSTSCLDALRKLSLWPTPQEFIAFMFPHWNHILDTRIDLMRLHEIFRFGLEGADERGVW